MKQKEKAFQVQVPSDIEMTRAVLAKADEAIAELETRLAAENQRMQNAVHGP
jgi:hypothetical protein